MNIYLETQHLLDQEAKAWSEMKRPEELGSTCNVTLIRGQLLSVCCQAPKNGAVYVRNGTRYGWCSACGRDCTLEEANSVN